ncbi:MAG: D-amino acid aminotransferase [Candidatus Aquirickettsiella gammari]|jgi:D-alanine transaminase
MSQQIVYLNGEFTPINEAKISVLDRGFIYGDGVYEVIPIYNRKALRQSHHLARLGRSLAKIGMNNPYSEHEWQLLIDKIMATQAADDQLIYIQVTRGVAKRAHAFPLEVTPTIFMMTNPMDKISDEVRERGVKCVSMEDLRWQHCDIKSTSLLGNVLAAQFAVENEATEAIQFRDNFLTEGSASNVWVVKNKQLIGTPLDGHVLEGIRVSLLEEMCAELNIPYVQRPISREEVFAADEVLLTSASKEILAVVQIDGKNIGDGKKGEITQILYDAYQLKKA